MPRSARDVLIQSALGTHMALPTYGGLRKFGTPNIDPQIAGVPDKSGPQEGTPNSGNPPYGALQGARWMRTPPWQLGSTCGLLWAMGETSFESYNSNRPMPNFTCLRRRSSESCLLGLRMSLLCFCAGVSLRIWISGLPASGSWAWRLRGTSRPGFFCQPPNTRVFSPRLDFPLDM